MEHAKKRTLTLLEHGLRGASAGLTYGIVERLFASVVPWLLKPTYVYQPPNRASVVVLLLVYALAGGALQVLLAAIWRSVREEVADIIVRLFVIAVFATNFTIEYLPPYVLQNRKLYAATLAAQVMALAVAVLIELAPWFGRRRVVGMVSLSLLLILPWYLIIDLFAERHLRFKAVVGAAAVISVLAVGWFLRWTMPRRVAATASLLCSVAIVGVALIARQTVHQTSPPKLSRLAARFPNVVLVTLDTVRADHLSIYGYSRPTTPNLARFAREATLFTHAFSSGNMTLSTHASLFTGLEPRSHGAQLTPDFLFGRPLGPGIPTMAEVLASRGYDTIGVVANSGFLGHAFGLNRGFRYYDQRIAAPFLGQMSEYCIGRGVADAARRIFAPYARFVSGRSAEEINRDVDEGLRRGSGRFLLFVNYLDAHWPYDSPRPFATTFVGADPNYNADEYLPHALASDASQDYCRGLMGRYDGAIQYVDDQVGKLLDTLRTRGLYDDALIIITSDHGEAFGERHQLSHGMSVYENQIRIPLIVKVPHQSAPQVVSTPVSTLDVFEMILAACGVPRPQQADRSMQRYVMAEHFGVAHDGQVAITDGRLKLIREANGSMALYDLVPDPLEQVDVLRDPAYAARAAELASGLDVRLARADREKQKFSTSSDVDESYLRSLGYLR